jgi:hypothetical protein
MPYIEAYLLDNLIGYLEVREMCTSDFEVYYVQNAKLERYEFLNNARDQLREILAGETVEETDAFLSDFSFNDGKGSGEEELVAPEDRVKYSTFRLYCTKTVSLEFRLKDYPYGETAMTFPQFLAAFRERMGGKIGVRRHYYVTAYGGGKARAAFDTLSLSLYLVRLYEREEVGGEEGELEVEHLDAKRLREILETAWVKVNLARQLAKGNESMYFSLKQDVLPDEESDPEARAAIEVGKMIGMVEKGNDSPERLYRKISYFYDRTPEEVAADHRKEFNEIMGQYLVSRDETRETGVASELEERIRDNELEMTAQCPSKEEYTVLVQEKQKEISSLFDSVLQADYVGVDFTAEKRRAEKAYGKYQKAKACLYHNIFGDVIFMLIALLSVLLPYGILQLSSHFVGTTEMILLLLNTLALFGGLFFLAVVIRVIPLIASAKSAKNELKDCYVECMRKERASMAQIHNRYEVDLLRIERARYELRQLKRLYEANLAKDANVQRHRDMLEEVEDRLAGILNNLDVEPSPDPNESVEGEFDLSKPIRAKENKVYRVFSIETIEKLFLKKGRDELW